MKIDAIVLREVEMQLRTPVETSFGTLIRRRVLLVELLAEGLRGWGECVAGEHPRYSEETVDSAWSVLGRDLAPLLLASDPEHGGHCHAALRALRGNRMAKAALEMAFWDWQAQAECVSLAALLGGLRAKVACGLTIGIQPSLARTLEQVEAAVEAGYQRVKLLVKPGWDLAVIEPVRARWPHLRLAVDANGAYRLKDMGHLAEFDRFDLMMLEQPLWSDDFYHHSMLQKQIETPVCLDESIRNRRDALAAIAMDSCRIVNVKPGRVGGFTEAIGIHNAAMERGVPVWCGGMLETGIGRAHNLALASLPNFTMPGDLAPSNRYWVEDIVEPAAVVSQEGEIAVPTEPGRGFAVREALVERLTVRREEVRAYAMA